MLGESSGVPAIEGHVARRRSVSGAVVVVTSLALVAACSPAALQGSTLSATAPASGTPSFAVDLGLGEPLDSTLGNPGYDVGRYEIDLAFDPASSWLDATVTLRATATARLSFVNVDFVGFDVQAVTVDGEPAAFARTERDMTIRPRTAIAAGRTFELAVRYRGQPKPFHSDAGVPVGLGWNVSTTGTSYVVSEPDGARSWFPCNDVPSDRATYTFRLTVPDGLVAAANGVLEGRATAGHGRTTWTWQMDRPMATYLATVIVGRYRIEDDGPASVTAGVPIRNLLPVDASPAPSPDPQSTTWNLPPGTYDARGLALQGEMIAFYSRYLGPFPYPTYGIAYVPGAIGALEAQTLTVSGTTDQSVLAHELAHQWLGDAVSLAHWGDIWLNEGFATYMEWLWEEHRGESLAGNAALGYDLVRGLPPPGNPPLDDLFNESVYVRGGLTLYALRARIGDAAFFATLRAWADRYAGRPATTADFISLAEGASGADLTGFFDAWLYAADMPPLPGSSGSEAAAPTVPG